LGLQPKFGGRSHLKLNISGRPIAKKYSDGKVKRTLKRRSKVLETVKRETDGVSDWCVDYPLHLRVLSSFVIARKGIACGELIFWVLVSSSYISQHKVKL